VTFVHLLPGIHYLAFSEIIFQNIEERFHVSEFYL